MAIAVPVFSESLVECAEATGRHLGSILGTDYQVISIIDLIKDIKKPSFDLYFCISSGTDINLFDPKFSRIPFKKTAVWFVTSKSTRKQPKNLFFVNTNFLAKWITSKGGWSFFAQYEDFVSALSTKTAHRVSWLPPCADVGVYKPSDEPKVFDAAVVFNANIQTNALEIVDKLIKNGVSYIKLPYLSQIDLTKKTYNLAYFSIHATGANSMYNELDTPFSVFDSLASGVPVITNGAPNLPKLFNAPTYLKTYDNIDQAIEAAKDFKQNINSKMAAAARAKAELFLSYDLRMDQAVDALRTNGVLPANG